MQMVLMIICICRRLNTAKIETAVKSGARSPEDVQAFHGCAFNCGKCRPAIGEMIASTMDALTVKPALAPAE